MILLAGVFVLCLASCTRQNQTNTKAANPQNNAVAEASKPNVKVDDMNLALGSFSLRDSVEVLSLGVIDVALKEASDSIAQAKYFTLAHRDSVAKKIGVSEFIDENKKKQRGITNADFAKAANLQGLVSVRLARFGNVLATEFIITNPTTKEVIFKDNDFNMIRFRDSNQIKILGPTLVESFWKSLSKYFKQPNKPNKPIITKSVVITSFEIQKNGAIANAIKKEREELSINCVKSMGEFGRRFYSSLMIFDYESRNQLYKLMNSPLVQDYEPPTALERNGLFAVGVDKYVVGGIYPANNDSAKVRLKMINITSFSKDEVSYEVEKTYPNSKFETLGVEKELIGVVLDAANELFEKENSKIVQQYQEYISR